MQKIICKNYDEASRVAALLFAKEIEKKPDLVIGLATGSTPIGLYRELAKKNKTGEIDFSSVVSYNLDEYYPIKKDNEQSYRYFMFDNLFNHINIKEENVHIFDGECADPAVECAKYDAAIKQSGGIDVQLLGIGGNGHIAFNEPDEWMETASHVVNIKPETIKDNARFFNSIEDVPKTAMSLGLGGIFHAKKIIMIATGANKAKVVKEMLSGKISTSNPATLLSLHPDVTVIIDEAANGE